MKYEGEVSELELIPALVELGSESFTGALRFENDSIIKIVYFKDGAVLSASTNDRSDSIDEILLKSGKVSRDHVKQALSKRKDDETLGDALLGLGFITRKELSWARRVQLIGILRSITTWGSGSYTLVADYLPKREDGPAFQYEQIVLELVLTDTDRPKYDALLESGAVVFRPSAIFDEKFGNLGLNQEAAGVVQLINGSRTATEVVAESTSDAFNVYKLMHALHLLGLLEKSAGRVDLGLGSPSASTIEPTVEMPMDFGVDVGKREEATPEFDFGTPSGPGVDLSWQEPAAPAEPAASSSSELLPSIDADLPSESGGYAYEPSVKDAAPPVILTEDLPEQDARSAPPPPSPPQRASAPARPGTTGNGAGRKLAFLAVGVLIIAALAYAGYLYFMNPGEDAPELVAGAPAVQQAGASVSAEPGETGTTEAAVDTAEMSSEPETPAAAEPETPTPPPAQAKPAAPVPAAAPRPAPATGRLADAARGHLADAPNVPYTIQFALLCQDYSVENAMKVGGRDFWFVPITYQGRNCYRAFWGRYATRADAEQGISTIPASLRGGKAVVIAPASVSN